MFCSGLIANVNFSTPSTNLLTLDHLTCWDDGPQSMRRRPRTRSSLTSTPLLTACSTSTATLGRILSPSVTLLKKVDRALLDFVSTAVRSGSEAHDQEGHCTAVESASSCSLSTACCTFHTNPSGRLFAQMPARYSSG